VSIRIEIDAREIEQALARSPRALVTRLGRAVRRGGAEVAREARAQAPKAFTTLTQSIRSAQGEDVLTAVVAPTVAYGPYVELGTGRFGPGGTASRRMPPTAPLVDWIRRKRITPDEPWMDEEDLAYVIGRSIAARGTPRQPYLRPALRKLSPRVVRLIYEGLQAGIAEATR